MLELFESKINEIIGVIDQGLRSTSGHYGRKASFEGESDTGELSKSESKKSASLMRVNHVGEVCAQALYLGQALTAKSDAAKAGLLRAAEEEREHLGWCEQRLDELDGSTSILSPLFFVASAGVGAITGLLGDRISLGFVEATEDQVVEHLDRHIEALPEADHRSREILESIRQDEFKHGEKAIDSGGVRYPAYARQIMTLASRLMTETSKHI